MITELVEGVEMSDVLALINTHIFSYLCHKNDVNISGGSHIRDVMIIVKITPLGY